MDRKKLIRLIKLLEEVVTIIQQTKSVLLWTKAHSKEEIILELNVHIQRLRSNDLTKIDEIKLLFAPTGELQDLSLDSGWGETFLVISSQVDNLFEGGK
ncbi:MAG: hypothetical protein ACXADY_10205 [Candidatus Hodarchaeales archaeon]|jgi:hypothetical protein